SNPVARLSGRSGLEIYPAPPGQKLRIGKRNAREGEMEDYLAALVRTNRAIQEAARGKADVSCMQAVPKDLGDWRAAVEFVMGPFACGKGLHEISAMDFRARWSAMPMRIVGRATARCWGSSPPICRCNLASRRNDC